MLSIWFVCQKEGKKRFSENIGKGWQIVVTLRENTNHMTLMDSHQLLQTKHKYHERHCNHIEPERADLRD